jgi:hypothetical protein
MGAFKGYFTMLLLHWSEPNVFFRDLQVEIGSTRTSYNGSKCIFISYDSENGRKSIAFHSSGIILYINIELNLANRYHRFQIAKENIWFRPMQEQHSKITFECPH